MFVDLYSMLLRCLASLRHASINNRDTLCVYMCVTVLFIFCSVYHIHKWPGNVVAQHYVYVM